ncbi:NAD(P)-dependent oxidoreductase [Nocardia cyriacigeorgica]|uniref:NAD(P)-dependent oxidoreductase n=1 Tax=Nocardia cyriacigeorgica TaxID=135487 RepID=A0A5R8PA21_9NOCA|nr:NAD(P)-binding domain-containing protein [Nocardia cyriacigeorgica]TLG04660.1 NAD(P)-dependent oxidoreductase [Nocardia cyriacigeorgica]
MTDNSTSVTVLGLGRIGAALAELFLRNGHPTTVWNRTPGKADHLDGLGARRTESVAEAIGAGELIVVAGVDTETATALVGEAGELVAGRDVLNVATGRPDQARELATLVTERGGRFLDGAILGVPQTLGSTDTLFLYSGSPEAQQRHADTLAELGTVNYLGADAGLAGLHDMAVLAGMYGLFGGFFQAVAMVDSEGVGAVPFTEDYLIPWLRSLLDLLPGLAAEIDSREFPVNFSDLAANRIGLDNIRTAARNQGVSTELLDPLQRLFDTQTELGRGADSFTAAVTGLRTSDRPAGVH